MGLGSLTVPCPLSKKRRMKEKRRRRGSKLVEERRADVKTMLWMWVRRVAGPGLWYSPASPASVFSMG